jgi:curved DNA-binding protein CbpA
MKNLYDILELERTASSTDIRKAYKRLALIAHPDKGGSAEQMGLLTEAYNTLMSPTKRQQFDEEWAAYSSCSLDADEAISVSGYLPTAGVPYSVEFRYQHINLVQKYQQTPLAKGSIRRHLKVFSSNIYECHPTGGERIVCHDIFSFIRKKSEVNPSATALIKPWTHLTPKIAVAAFIDFLSGEYNLPTIRELLNKFSKNIAQLKSWRRKT